MPKNERARARVDEEKIRELEKQVSALQELILKVSLAIQQILMKKKRTIPTRSNPKYIVIHHGAGDWDFNQINLSHKNRWGFVSSLGFYMGYHYFIERDGRIYQARVDTEKAAHTVEPGKPGYWNSNSIGISLQGNFEEIDPTEKQLSSLHDLVTRKMYRYNIGQKEVYGHRDIVPTLCPGKSLYKWLLDWKQRYGDTL